MEWEINISPELYRLNKRAVLHISNFFLVWGLGIVMKLLSKTSKLLILQ